MRWVMRRGEGLTYLLFRPRTIVFFDLLSMIWRGVDYRQETQAWSVEGEDYWRNLEDSRLRAVDLTTKRKCSPLDASHFLC
jgi:hypothetical protein